MDSCVLSLYWYSFEAVITHQAGNNKYNLPLNKQNLKGISANKLSEEFGVVMDVPDLSAAATHPSADPERKT